MWENIILLYDPEPGKIQKFAWFAILGLQIQNYMHMILDFEEGIFWANLACIKPFTERFGAIFNIDNLVFWKYRDFGSRIIFRFCYAWLWLL